MAILSYRSVFVNRSVNDDVDWLSEFGFALLANPHADSTTEIAVHISVARNAASGSVVRVDVTDYADKCAGRANATLVIVRQLRNPQYTGNAGAGGKRFSDCCCFSSSGVCVT